MEPREALDKVMSALPDIASFEGELESLNSLVNSGTTVTDDYESKYNEMRTAYERRWGEYTQPDTVRDVVDESITSGFEALNQDGTIDADINDLDMAFDGSTE